ncbi:prion-inhibition and propagation-domain-containing protein [Penicillium argentinense]|uniref:Prion-inhibition and propagation-domain-containing protein n=1 Tax=Penicillium argentinense TaxID=1131581 RepID=A0A9W9FMS2_9EURO|nr:prion-inhibition and propagation-domain-containing protein [Penicillium argentinense]KAJ5103039.1 prion-inhibition and propagation-domain-containing protein [Penicillium argentinense]
MKTIDRVVRNKILPRAENLAALLRLPEGEIFRSLTVRGIIEEDDVIPFVFNNLNTHHTQSFGRSLSSLETVAINHPASPSVFSWLFESLTLCENILFYLTNNTTDAAEILQDSILAGFSFARPSAPSDISEQPSADHKQDTPTPGSALEWRALRYLVEDVNVGVGDVPLSRLVRFQPFLLRVRGKGGTSK